MNLRRRIARALRPGSTYSAIQSEIQFHMDMRIEEYVRAGMPRSEARRKAANRFGSVHVIIDDCYRVRKLPPRRFRRSTIMESVAQDIRYAIRSLRRQPMFTLTAILTLAVGIGTSTLVFGAVQSTLLRPLPYEGADRLYTIRHQQQGATIRHQQEGGTIRLFPTNEYIDAWRERAATIEIIAGYNANQMTMELPEGPTTINTALVSLDLFDLLGIQPRLGRGFASSDTITGANNVVMLTERHWASHYGRDPSAIGSSIRLDGTSYTIVGVAPEIAEAFFGTSRFSLWIPSAQVSGAVAKLKAGVTPEAALQELEAIRLQQLQQGEGIPGSWPIALNPVTDNVPTDLRTALWVLLGAVGFVMLVACVNVANMLLTRGLARTHEMAVRSSIGARPARLMRQLTIESLLLTLGAAVIGLLLANLARGILIDRLPSNLGPLQHMRLDPFVLGTGIAAAVLTGLIFGVLPLSQIRASEKAEVLHSGGRTTAGPWRARVRAGFVTLQFALAVVLFVGASLMTASLIRLGSRDPGFNAENLVTFQIRLPSDRYSGQEQVEAFTDEVLIRLRQLPTVLSASYGTIGDFFGFMDADIVVEGSAANESHKLPMQINVVAPDYFTTIGMPMLEGRTFLPSEIENSDQMLERTIIVGRTLAQALSPDGSIVGKRFRSVTGQRYTTVVGVVPDVVVGAPSDRPAYQAYYSSGAFPWATTQSFVTRVTGDLDDVMPLMRGQIWSVDGQLPIENVVMATERLHDGIARPRFNARILSTFAIITLLLAAVGVYGVIALSVQQRVHELGVRIALGATGQGVVRLMVAAGMRPIVFGAVLGVVASIGLTRFLQTLLYDVSATEPAIFLSATTVLVGTGLLACFIPARRAARVDPITVLRTD